MLTGQDLPGWRSYSPGGWEYVREIIPSTRLSNTTVAAVEIAAAMAKREAKKAGGWDSRMEKMVSDVVQRGRHGP